MTVPKATSYLIPFRFNTLVISTFIHSGYFLPDSVKKIMPKGPDMSCEGSRGIRGHQGIKGSRDQGRITSDQGRAGRQQFSPLIPLIRTKLQYTTNDDYTTYGMHLSQVHTQLNQNVNPRDNAH